MEKICECHYVHCTYTVVHSIQYCILYTGKGVRAMRWVKPERHPVGFDVWWKINTSVISGYSSPKTVHLGPDLGRSARKCFLRLTWTFYATSQFTPILNIIEYEESLRAVPSIDQNHLMSVVNAIMHLRLESIHYGQWSWAELRRKARRNRKFHLVTLVYFAVTDSSTNHSP